MTYQYLVLNRIIEHCHMGRTLPSGPRTPQGLHPNQEAQTGQRRLCHLETHIKSIFKKIIKQCSVQLNTNIMDYWSTVWSLAKSFFLTKISGKVTSISKSRNRTSLIENEIFEIQNKYVSWPGGRTECIPNVGVWGYIDCPLPLSVCGVSIDITVFFHFFPLYQYNFFPKLLFMLSRKQIGKYMQVIFTKTKQF